MAEATAHFGRRDETPFSLGAFTPGGGLAGALNGLIHWRWLYIRHFFVRPEWRGRGLGRALLRRAEDFAREKNCVGLYLDTFDPGAEEFYRRCGFAAFGQLDNFPPGAARRFLSKALE